MDKITNDTPAVYQATTPEVADLQVTINTALQLLFEELQRQNLHATVETFTAPEIVKNYLTLSLALAGGTGTLSCAVPQQPAQTPAR